MNTNVYQFYTKIVIIEESFQHCSEKLSNLVFFSFHMLSMFVHILLFSEYDLIRNNNNVIQHNLFYKGFSE